MAIDNRLQIFDEQGNPVDYDILASDVKFMPDGKDLPTKLSEMQEEIEDAGSGDGTVTGVKVGNTPYNPDSQGVVDLSTPFAGKVDKDPNKELIPSTDLAKLQNLPTSDQLTQQLGQKANDADVVKSISVNGQAPAATPDQNGNVNIQVQGGAQGPKGDKGDTVVVGGEQEFTIVNDTTTGGASDALSAEMGKRVAGREATDRQRINAIVDILKKSVFTDDQTAAFAALDALANGIDSISFNASSHKFTGIGDTFTLSVVTDPVGKTAQISSWSSSNTSVATVNNNGVVTSVADGDAVITATTTDGKVAVCNIKVTTVVINGVSLNKSTLTLNGNDANETLVATTNPTGYESGVQWSSSDPTKATVDNNGKVTAVANGSAVITASIGGHSATCQVTVTGVMQTFHVNVGTLSNVTITDGQGNAITDGQAVAEGSALTINFAPASSHEISALSVVMGSTSLSLADATDGTNGVKVIAIQSVSGDIAVSASATYVAKNYYNDGVDLNGKGVKYTTSGVYGSDSQYKCRIVPLDFGKFYRMTYKWTGTSGGYNIALVKSDGNGGYTNLINGTDVTPPTKRGINGLTYATNANIYRMTTSSSATTFHFPIFEKSLYNVDEVFLAVNTKFSSDTGVTECSIKEFAVETSLDFQSTAIAYPEAYFMGTNISSRIFPVKFGASYTYSGYNQGTTGGYNMGIVALIGGVFRSLEKAEATNVDSFFSETTYVTKMTAPTSKTFSIPALADVPSNTSKLFFVANLKYSNDSVDNSDFTITEVE